MIQENLETGKHVLDALSIGTLVATFWQLLPHGAALLTFIWAGFRLYNAYLDKKIKTLEITIKQKELNRT